MELLKKLISFDSTSRNSNLPLADFLCDYLDRPGVTIERNLSPDGTKTNLLVWIGPDSNPAARDGLILSGHMDVVPADEDDWRSDPFVATRIHDHWVGRGTADMKGFLATAVNLLAMFDTKTARAPLALLFTYDEEVGTIGARHFVETWKGLRTLPRHVIIGEPTSLKPIRMHKGHMTVRFTTTGISAHSGLPHLGKNAIEPAAKIVNALAQLRDHLAQERPDSGSHFPEVPFLAINVGRISGGSAINVVPDECHIDVGVRTLPGTNIDDLANRLRTAANTAVGTDSYNFEIQGDSPPLLLDQKAPIHQAVCAEVGEEVSHGVAYATDAGWFQNLELDCLIFGPGSITVAHKPNEAIPHEELTRGKEHIEHLVRKFCAADA